MAVIAVAKNKIKNHRKVVVGCLLTAVIVAGTLVYISNKVPATSAIQDTELSNEAFIKGDKTLALERAKQALVKDPNNVDTILLVTNIMKTENPGQAKQYYVQALNKFKQQDNPDVPGKSAVTYWAAAGLAHQAGETSQAKQYYEKVIQTANPSDGYQQSLAKQSQDELARMQ